MTFKGPGDDAFIRIGLCVGGLPLAFRRMTNLLQRTIHHPV